jgi:hypothetical protein
MPDSKAKTKAGKQRFVAKAMHEFGQGEMRSGSGAKVTNPKQAVAIALHQTGQSKPSPASARAGSERKGSSSRSSGNNRLAGELDRRLDQRSRRRR